MRAAAKAALVPVLIVVACLAAGVHGALHNQISFTVGPAYFHDLKFDQFRLPASLHDHWGAAIVGWRASWWMGLLLAPPLVMAALFAPGPRAAGRAFLRGTLATAIVTLLVSSGGLALAGLILSDVSGFDLAASMHDASYLGSSLGALVGLAVTFRSVLRADRAMRVVDTQPAHG